MNCIFIKKVADTTINKKSIKFGIERIGNESYILEVKISEKICNDMTRVSNSNKYKAERDNKISKLMDRMLLNLRLKKFEKEIRKIVLQYFHCAIIFIPHIPSL